jgi:hypothetical protein
MRVQIAARKSSIVLWSTRDKYGQWCAEDAVSMSFDAALRGAKDSVRLASQGFASVVSKGEPNPETKIELDCRGERPAVCLYFAHSLPFARKKAKGGTEKT